MWLGTVLHLSLAAAMNDELQRLKSSLADKKQEQSEAQTQLGSKKTLQESKESPTLKTAQKGTKNQNKP